MTNKEKRAIIQKYGDTESVLREAVANRTHHTAMARMVIIFFFPWGNFDARGRILRVFLFFAGRYTTISTKDLLINDEIRAKEVRLVGADGEQLGVMPLSDAKEYAYSRDLDLVMMAATATPPVCRAMDYGKFRFERDKKEKEARKKQQITKLKEVQLSCRIDVHDFETRVNHAKRFLGDGDKVKAVVRFRGREMTHMELGREVIQKFLDACADCGVAEKGATVDGRYMSVVISPIKGGAAKTAENKG